jgi:cysteine desulfurase/selenocysteine lyase
MEEIASPPATETLFDVHKIRQDFPILGQQVNGKPLVYLDNAATSQKPQSVIDAIARYYLEENSNIHRGVHTLSDKATQSYEAARTNVQTYIHAAHREEILFVRGTTEGINLVASSWGGRNVQQDDEIIISAMEHHSNIVPWQILCERTGARLRIIPMSDSGELLLDKFEQLFSAKTKLVSVVHVSNALGTVNPVRRMIDVAHRHGVPVLIDGAQAIPHMAVDVQELGCDFYAFSGHKMFGPTGVGILYGKKSFLESMPPYQGGGDMIKSVTFEKTIYNDLPNKFEAGTPNISGGVALGAAIDYLKKLDPASVAAYEQQLLAYATDALASIRGVRIIGTAAEKAGVISFVLEGIHPHDIGTILDDDGIAIRTGHHCAQPVMQRFGIPATARASFALYNTREEVDALVRGIYNVITVLT